MTIEAIQQVLTVLFVLALLGGTLFWFRGKGLASIWARGMHPGGTRRMQSIERLPLAPQHSLHLVRVAGKVLLIGVSPGGCAVLDGDCREVSS
jgi:flagellar biogenesis protein FliO